MKREREKVKNTDKWAIVKDYESKHGHRFIEVSQIEQMLGIKTKGYVKRRYLQGLDTYGSGKMYYFPDVLDRLRDVRA